MRCEASALALSRDRLSTSSHRIHWRPALNHPLRTQKGLPPCLIFTCTSAVYAGAVSVSNSHLAGRLQTTSHNFNRARLPRLSLPGQHLLSMSANVSSTPGLDDRATALSVRWRDSPVCPGQRGPVRRQIQDTQLSERTCLSDLTPRVLCR